MNTVCTIEDICSAEDLVNGLKARNICIAFKDTPRDRKKFKELMRLLDDTGMKWISGRQPSHYTPSVYSFITTIDDVASGDQKLYCYRLPLRGEYTAEELLEACQRGSVPVVFDDLGSILFIPK